jgi:hypothetical protein
MTEASSFRPRSGNGASTNDPGDSQRGIVDRLRNAATAQLTDQKNRATDGLGSIANAVRQTTQQLREQQHDVIAGYVDQAADQIEQFSRRLREREVTQLFSDLQDLSRRQPTLFVGGAFAVGFVAARFLKSGSRSTRSERDESAGSAMPERERRGEQRAYANAHGQTQPEAPSASTVHDYSSFTSSLGGSIGSSESMTGSDAADADVNAPETGNRKSRARRTTTQTERP